jgi:DNA-binding transcriptional MerR regulator
MRIGELAAQANVNVETLRYYQRRGLLAIPGRRASGYRAYDAAAVQRVRFIRRAQQLGFTLHEIDGLLALWTDSADADDDACEAVEARARIALERIDGKIRDLTTMRRGLNHHIAACHRHHPLDTCPLLAEIGGLEAPK